LVAVKKGEPGLKQRVKGGEWDEKNLPFGLSGRLTRIIVFSGAFRKEKLKKNFWVEGALKKGFFKHKKKKPQWAIGQ